MKTVKKNLFLFCGFALFHASINRVLAAGAITPFTVLEAESGTLGVTPANLLPGKIQFNVSGNILNLSWPTNAGWFLQLQTNLLTAKLNTN